MSDAAETTEASEPSVTSRRSSDNSRLPDPDEVARYLQWGVLALLVLFALVAAVSLYTNINRIIQVWVTREYQPVFSAAFNLLVLLLAGAGISLLLRRIARERRG